LPQNDLILISKVQLHFKDWLFFFFYVHITKGLFQFHFLPLILLSILTASTFHVSISYYLLDCLIKSCTASLRIGIHQYSASLQTKRWSYSEVKRLVWCLTSSNRGNLGTVKCGCVLFPLEQHFCCILSGKYFSLYPYHSLPQLLRSLTRTDSYLCDWLSESLYSLQYSTFKMPM